jgi:hypothetical protein
MARLGPQEFVCEALMIAFGVVVRHKVGDRALKRGLSDRCPIDVLGDWTRAKRLTRLRPLAYARKMMTSPVRYNCLQWRGYLTFVYGATPVGGAGLGCAKLIAPL